MQYKIFEGNMDRLEKKLKRIENKCKQYGNTEFKFNVLGEEYQNIRDDNGNERTIKRIIIDVEGVAKVNDWMFVGTIQHKYNGNIIRQFNTDIEVPEKYRYTDSICEHCNCKRVRKDTYLIYNEQTHEFKQVGKSCLNDFTNGLSAEQIAKYISWFDEIIEGQEVMPMNSKQYYSVEKLLLNAIETIKHYGFVSKAMAMESSDRFIQTTSERVSDFMLIYRLFGKQREIVQNEMERINYNAESDENKKELAKMIEWLKNTDNDGQYISNLKIAVADTMCEYRDFGLIVSLPSAYFKAMEKENDRIAREQRNAEKMVLKANKQYVGRIGERIDINIQNIECVTSFDTLYGTMRIYRIEDKNGNALIWKTSNFIDRVDKVTNIKATIKDHSEYNGEKQTELSRVKIIG